jgi:transcriptional regulator with XRE-family HTH domain
MFGNRPERISDVFRRRLKEVRNRRGWSQEELARRLAGAGYQISREKVAKIETSKTARIDVDDLFAICAVLSVSPLHMLIPLDDESEVNPVPSMPIRAREMRAWVRALPGVPTLPEDAPYWIRGGNPLDAEWREGEDMRIYATELPLSEQQDVVRWARQAVEGLSEKEARLRPLPLDQWAVVNEPKEDS